MDYLHEDNPKKETHSGNNKTEIESKHISGVIVNHSKRNENTNHDTHH